MPTSSPRMWAVNLHCLPQVSEMTSADALLQEVALPGGTH